MTNRASTWTIGLAVVLMAIALAAGVWFLRGRGGESTAETNHRPPTTTLPMSMADTAPLAPPRDPARPSVTFDDGTVATLVGLRSFGFEPAASWGADGSAVALPKKDDAFHRSVGGFNERYPGVEVRIAWQADDRDTKSYNARFADHRGNASQTLWDGPDGAIFYGIFGVPPGHAESELEVGLASGDWQDKDVLTVADSPARAAAAEPFAVTPRPTRTTRPSTGPMQAPPIPITPFRILSITDDNGRTRVAYTSSRYWQAYGDAQWQAVLRPTSGKDRHYKNVDYTAGRVTFIYDLPLDKVKAAVYQERPWQWKSLGPVRLQPTTLPTTEPAMRAP